MTPNKLFLRAAWQLERDAAILENFSFKFQAEDCRGLAEKLRLAAEPTTDSNKQKAPPPAAATEWPALSYGERRPHGEVDD